MNINNILVELIIFIIVIMLGLVIGKIVYNTSKKIIKEFELTRIFKKLDIKFNPEKLLPPLLKCLIYFFTVLAALNIIGIAKIVIKAVIVLIVIFAIIYILISTGSMMPNIYYKFKLGKKCRIGKRIKYKNIEGEITGMNLTEIKVKTKKEMVYIPYKILR